jgi:elongation factor P--beta-lysine ligase
MSALHTLKKQDAWQPSASLSHLRARAHIIKQIRDFFEERGVM